MLYKKYFFVTEHSSLNIFWSPINSNQVYISTARDDIPGPILNFNCRLPIKRTSEKIYIEDCQHTFIHVRFEQCRRADEAPTSIVKCTKCNLHKRNE